VPSSLVRLAVVCARLQAGFGSLAKHAGVTAIADEAASLAAAHGAIADEVGLIASTLGIDMPRLKATCGERLRWEWLASSARLTDGSPEPRLLAECTRLQDEAVSLDRDAAALSPIAMRQIRMALERMRASAERLISP
jgi:hypothetical protein